MMRVITGLMWLTAAFWIAADDVTAQPKNGKATPAGDWPREVVGLGVDVAGAKKAALEQAQNEISKFLLRQKPAIRWWQPSTDFVHKHLIHGEGRLGDDLPVALEQLPNAKSWIVTLRPPDMNLFRRLDREARGQLVRQEADRAGGERVMVAVKILVGVLALLLAVVAFCQLDMWMQRHVSAWWKAAFAGLLVITGAGIWFVI